MPFHIPRMASRTRLAVRFERQRIAGPSALPSVNGVRTREALLHVDVARSAWTLDASTFVYEEGDVLLATIHDPAPLDRAGVIRLATFPCSTSRAAGGRAAERRADAEVQRHRRWLQLIYLPAYAPEEQPLDHLFRVLRGRVTHRHQRAVLDALEADAEEFFRELDRDPSHALLIIGSPVALPSQGRAAKTA
jgi:hypothetical protein